MGALISIIIPVYNSAQYISDCIASIRAQSYVDYEVLLVDDGSTDESRAICQKLCEEDNRIRLIQKRHAGVSAARNEGMREAQGKYLFFLDSDDTIHFRLLETLYQLLEKTHAVIASEKRYCMRDSAFSGYSGDEAEMTAADYTYLKNEQAIDCRVFANTENALYGIGGKMILRKAAENIEFDEKLTHGEDTLFMYQLIAKGADVLILQHAWYYYRKHEGGAAGVFSVGACESRYTVERRICVQEIRSRRTENAVYWENAILSAIMQWYAAGKKDNDSRLTVYAKKRADIERKRKIFSKVNIIKRFEFYCMFYCYPLYRFFPVILQIWRMCMKIWSKRWRIRWLYGWIKWRVIWCGQISWILLWKVIWRCADIYRKIFKGRCSLDGQEES